MSKRTFYVIEKSDCSQCSGSGVVSEGYHSPLTDKWDRREMDCPACGGSGEGERRVDLADAIEELMQPGSDLHEFVSRVLGLPGLRRSSAVASMLANGILPD